MTEQKNAEKEFQETQNHTLILKPSIRTLLKNEKTY